MAEYDSKYKNMGMWATFAYEGYAEGFEETGKGFVDKRTEDDPIRALLGEHKIPAGVEEALMTMEVGEERDITVPPEKGYSWRSEKDVQWYPKAMLPDGYKLHLHSQLFWTNPEDKSRRLCTVVEETEDEVKIDMNHPYAGRVLHYKLKLLELK